MSLVFDQYTDRLRRKRRSPNTLRFFASASTRLDRWLSAQGIVAEDASHTLLEEYFDNLASELQPTSAASHLRMIRAAYNYAVLRGTLRQNPALDLEVSLGPDKEPTIISGECLRVIRSRIMYQRDWVFFHLLTYTGMRRAEIQGLVYDDGSDDRSVVRLEEQTIRVLGKGRKMRLVPIHPALGEILVQEDRTPGRYVVAAESPRGVSAWTIQEMVKRLSPVFTPHDYRRTVATSLARNGVEDRVLDRIMGWARRAVRDRYYVNVAPEELHRAMLRLYADDPL